MRINIVEKVLKDSIKKNNEKLKKKNMNFLNSEKNNNPKFAKNCKLLTARIP